MDGLSVVKDYQALSRAAAARFIELAGRSLSQGREFCVALAGGRTPLGMYDLLRQEKRLNWGAIHVFWSDERCVPHDHPDSNYRLAAQALLDRVDIPSENVHPIQGALPAAAAAEAYEEVLARWFEAPISGPPPSFDLVLLGFGPDGHIASLFPGAPALDETQRWVVPVQHSTPPEPLVDRVGFSLPLINAAQEVIVLVSGEPKAAAFALAAADGNLQLPAARLRPAAGRLSWLADQAAAGPGG
ncbi:MAG: 6-phosphogluconolactonase [Chloroflexota bacterium]